jgi:hypothetical protein
MGAFARIPLWVMLPCLAVSLVACGGFAFGVAGVAAARLEALVPAPEDPASADPLLAGTWLRVAATRNLLARTWLRAAAAPYGRYGHGRRPLPTAIGRAADIWAPDGECASRRGNTERVEVGSGRFLRQPCGSGSRPGGAGYRAAGSRRITSSRMGWDVAAGSKGSKGWAGGSWPRWPGLRDAHAPARGAP